MSTWETFEIQCTDYLQNKFGAYAKFNHKGGSDSTIPDILVETNTGKSFYIEVKHSPAQCGQFVLLPDLNTRTFQYSDKNITPCNEQANRITAYMNQYFDEFREAGTTGKEIDIPDKKNIFSNWIITTYGAKGVKFFITNHYTLLPLNRFGTYFDITAKYRVKRSGSSNVGKNRIKPVTEYIKSHTDSVIDSCINGDKLYIISSAQLHNQRFILNGYEYMFSLKKMESHAVYEIRRLSNTYNANVIFSVAYHPAVSGITDSEFINLLK